MPAAAAPSPSIAGILDKVSAAIRGGDLSAARKLAREGLSGGVEHPLLLNLRALDHEEAGRLEPALADLRRASALAPSDFSVLNALGLCLMRLQRPDEALDCYDRALGLRADFAPAWFNKAAALEQLGEIARAAEAYGRAAVLQPNNAQAFANLAWLAARRGDVADARGRADQALALQPANTTAALALAAAEMQTPEAAERRLRSFLERADIGAADRALAMGLLGDALDGLDQPAEAFAAYAQSNVQRRSDAAPRFETPGRATIPDTLAWLIPWADRWRGSLGRLENAAGRGYEVTHVFLLGFPRSGTTLAESALAAHRDVVSLEERNTLDEGVRAFMGDAASLSSLWDSAEEALDPFRDEYWRRVRSFGVEPAGKVFIDKNPFNTLKLPLIGRLFPQARIVFAVRDPRDVVLSGFRRRFNLNPSTFELLDLERAAAFYDGTMRLAHLLEGKLGLAWRPLVYERLVGDFEGEMRGLCDFIGVDWREELSQFAERGRRGDVASASAAQISRGLYSGGVGQWRRYQAELAPVLDGLRPWAVRLGYPAD